MKTFSAKVSESKIHPISKNIVLPPALSLPPSNNLHLPQGSGDDDLFIRVKGLLILGKLLGLIPCQGVFQKDCRRFKFRRFGWESLVNATVLIMLTINALVCFVGMCRVTKQNAADLAHSAASFVFYSNAAFLYTYFLRNSTAFIQLFTQWSKLNLNFYTRDKTLSRDTAIIVGGIFTSAVLENAILQFIEFPAFETYKNITSQPPLKIYYIRSHKYWDDIVPYHWTWALFAFFSNKLALYAWNFIDILIAVFSRALYNKFKLLNKAAEENIPPRPYNSEEDSKSDAQPWINLVRDHSSICSLLSEFQEFLSPLVFCSYAVNIYFTCLQLLIGLSPSQQGSVNPNHIKSKVYAVYATWSFIHLLLRLYTVSISAANINVHAHNISRSLKRCPVQFYSIEVERIERKVNTGPEIGLDGLGCFVVTKPFIMSIIGVVFTFEIVLLQASPQPSPCRMNNMNCIEQ